MLDIDQSVFSLLELKVFMSKNIIDVLSRGNQELFHSAVLAWLMDEQESHGLGKSFRTRILSEVGKNLGYDPNGDYEVKTECVFRRSRFDIILTPKGDAANQRRKGLVFENKFKSLAPLTQPKRYEAEGYKIVVIALLPELLEEGIEDRYQVLRYDVISNALKQLPSCPNDHYQFLLDQYRRFIDETLLPFTLISEYSSGTLALEDFIEQFSRAVAGQSFRDNDIRTFSHFYHSQLAEFIKRSAPDLVFGTEPYKSPGVNTKWFCQKNEQGAPFVETLIRRPFDPPNWTLHSQLRPAHETKDPTIAPRLEIRLNPLDIVRDHEIRHSWLLLGTWSQELLDKIRHTEPYRSIFKPRPRATRNFGCEPLHLRDLPFARMVECIRNMIARIFEPKLGSGADRPSIEKVSPVLASSGNVQPERMAAKIT
jgi:hypothetical protein